MMRSKSILTMVMAACAGAAIGCTKPEPGPVQKAGEKVDEAVEKVGDAINPKGPAEKAGRALDKAVGE